MKVVTFLFPPLSSVPLWDRGRIAVSSTVVLGSFPSTVGIFSFSLGLELGGW